MQQDKEPQKITAREMDVLRCLAENLKATEVAKKLFISYWTVVRHKNNLMRKLNAKNTAALVAIYLAKFLR